jgi:F-type H+-transporting ATPase subunit b
MELIQPDTGLLIWMFLSFLIVFLILRKAAWKPIIKGLRTRENNIEDALKSADKAREEMEKLKADNEKILEEAKAEKNAIIQEGKDLKDTIINEAKQGAEKEADKIIQNAQRAIENERVAAIEELKSQIANLSVEIAEKVLREKLGTDKAQKEYINKLIREAKLN